jgi:hypothetical protein
MLQLNAMSGLFGSKKKWEKMKKTSFSYTKVGLAIQDSKKSINLVVWS